MNCHRTALHKQRSLPTGCPRSGCRTSYAVVHSSRRDISEQLVPSQEASNIRRTLLISAISTVLLGSGSKAEAVSRSTLCVDTETEEEDTACRNAVLARDANKQEDYGKVSSRKFELAPNVPVADMNDAYTVATLKLSEEIESYCKMDVYDKQRIPLIKSLKADATDWVAKYARGGSARTLSARRMYIATDAVIGHIASNGYAPLPYLKVKTVLKTVDEAKDLLAKRS